MLFFPLPLPVCFSLVHVDFGWSYAHLRKELLAGYMADFNSMVRDIHPVTVDTRIVVLPVVPICFEGLDRVGRDLIRAVKLWVKWIGEKSGCKEVVMWLEYGRQGE
jgi:hypothetical protein